jgi:hypothetical protein
MVKSESAAGASKSLNQTISEIKRFLGQPPGGRGAKLRVFLHEKLADLAEKWYKKGFKRGHIESRKAFRESGAVPKPLRYKGSRELFAGQRRRLEVRSKIKGNRGRT